VHHTVIWEKLKAMPKRADLATKQLLNYGAARTIGKQLVNVLVTPDD
jgi:hypothetical protein